MNLGSLNFNSSLSHKPWTKLVLVIMRQDSLNYFIAYNGEPKPRARSAFYCLNPMIKAIVNSEIKCPSKTAYGFGSPYLLIDISLAQPPRKFPNARI